MGGELTAFSHQRTGIRKSNGPNLISMSSMSG
jgi:hypothetical protein